MQRKTSAGWLLALLACVVALAVSCSGGPGVITEDKPTSNGATADEQAEIAAAFDSPLRAAAIGEEQVWPGEFADRRQCFLEPGQRTFEGAVIRERQHLNPWGLETDPHVMRTETGWRMWFNSPSTVPNTKNLTRIAYAESDDGVLWSIPEIALTARDAGPLANGGVETPSVARKGDGSWWLAVLAKQVRDGHRTDRIMLFWSDSHRGPWRDTGVVMQPELSWEMPWRQPNGKMTGGVQEPCLHWFGDVLVCWYTAVRYSSTDTPSTGLAALLPGRREWVKWPTPVIPASGQIDVERKPGGLLWAFYGNRPGSGNSDLEMRWSRDGVTWSEPRVVLRRSSGWDRDRVVAPCYEDGRLYYFGSPVDQKVRWESWIGVAREVR